VLDTDDPLTTTRTGEPLYRELGLPGAARGDLLDALAGNAVPIERPIVPLGDRAVIARPPEGVLELLS
jgi:arsenate reductase